TFYPGKEEPCHWGNRSLRAGMLKLPNRTFIIEDLLVEVMERNQFGSVKIDKGPDFLCYKARFNGAASDCAVEATDISIPDTERPAIARIAKQLNLSSKTHTEILKSIKGFFETRFTYSLTRAAPHNPDNTLKDFLLVSRSGHCEYFATAAVLLLREAGIPARYATGYLVHEFSQLEDKFIVRPRHAHAWALAYINGGWQDLDPTPASWIVAENQTKTLGERISDIWSWLMFKITEWRSREAKTTHNKYLWWILIPLILILGWRIYAKTEMVKYKKKESKDNTGQQLPGSDSPFYLIEKRLCKLGFHRSSQETLSDWLKRIDDSHPQGILVDPLYVLLDIHYGYRFDPQGITTDQKEALNRESIRWLEQHIRLSA
ncbi:MAG: transglutaminase-like domain-containing protein, partial [Pseudomonadota bacterium]